MRPLLTLLLVGLLGCGPPAWREAQRDGSAGAYEQFAQDYNRYSQAAIALNRAESLRWAHAEETGKAAAWSAYLREHFQSRRADEARQHLDDAAYAEAVADKDALALERYLALFPEGAHTKEARKQLDGARWQDSKTEDTHTAYRRYLLQEPTGEHRDQAAERYAERIWERSARIDNLRSYGQYLQEFPKGEHAEDARARLGQLKFTEVQVAVALGRSAHSNRAQALGLLRDEASRMLVPILKTNGFKVRSVVTADLGADGSLDPSSAVVVPDGVGLVVVVVEDTAGEAYLPRGHATQMQGSVRVYVPARAGAMGTWSVSGVTSDRVRSIEESGLYKSAATALMGDAMGHIGRVRAWHPNPP